MRAESTLMYHHLRGDDSYTELVLQVPNVSLKFSEAHAGAGGGRGGFSRAWILAISHKRCFPPVFFPFQQADNWSVSPFQPHVISVPRTSPAFMHMCISQELFMLCLVFNTPSRQSESCQAGSSQNSSLTGPTPPGDFTVESSPLRGARPGPLSLPHTASPF